MLLIYMPFNTFSRRSRNTKNKLRLSTVQINSFLIQINTLSAIYYFVVPLNQHLYVICVFSKGIKKPRRAHINTPIKNIFVAFVLIGVDQIYITLSSLTTLLFYRQRKMYQIQVYVHCFICITCYSYFQCSIKYCIKVTILQLARNSKMYMLQIHILSYG